ncbi:DsbA family protein [Geobacter sp. DSM 9736]|uniref:DsbA family oxidoreductase n=1 Tax=Geobacter sp. DSM 9736 TaxID=1277350 RepID=UPI000B509A72|nr:DsbA family oxidoreductase [Geobacter sp. DSM 9736]SNB46966.1 Predicted dithiol-disulfide isomerase, DsbA family [Geobacter sp. DSM 9736]
MNGSQTLEVFSDYVCPFCWLAEPALEELQRAEPQLRIEWRAFELRPHTVPTLDPNDSYLVRIWEEMVYPMAEKLGVTMHLPPVQPRSRVAHQAALHAKAVGRFPEYHREIFRAFFERGEDIGQPDVLVALAEKLGMDGQRLRQVLVSGEMTDGVMADHWLAERNGINVVPAFLVDRKRLATGLQPTGALIDLVKG